MITTRVPVTTPAALLARRDAVVVDLRTPSEYAADHLPGAVNVPLFDDEARALVGLLYKQFSPGAAFAEGLFHVQGRISSLVREVAEHAGWPAVDDGDFGARVAALTAGGIAALESELTPEPVRELGRAPVVLHCWRGGLRSRSVIAFLRGLGHDAYGLAGGYQAYRRQVISELEVPSARPAFALRGLTGVGKTLVLRAIAALRPSWVVDLEGCAGHRSSLLGMVGLEPVGQKAFESALAASTRGVVEQPLVMEGESRRVGDALIPPGVWASLQGATNVLCTATTARRIEVLRDDYMARPEALPVLRRQLDQVAGRMGGRFPLVELFDAGRIDELVGVLLEHYYDPLYTHSEAGRPYARELECTDPVSAAREFVRWVESRPGTGATSG